MSGEPKKSKCAECAAAEADKYQLAKIIIAAALLASTLLISYPEPWRTAVLLAAYLIVGYSVLIEAATNLFRGRMLDENFLMSLATFGAIYVGEYPEAVAVMLFYQTGEYCEDLAVGKSQKSITELMDLRPDYANCSENGRVRKVSPDQLRIGDLIVCYPGEKVPVDGVVIEGDSFLDTAALTGEPVPREAQAGDAVLSGMVNQSAALTIRVAKLFTESTASRILDLVQNAQESKAPSEDFITRFARYYTPAVVGIALVIAFIAPLFLGQWSQYLYRACIFLVISCPCALVISIPLGFFSGIGKAGKEGILFKGSNYLEAFSKLGTVVFDKTGTLTKGSFEVRSLTVLAGSEERAKGLAAALEAQSHHPIAESIVRAYGRADKLAVTGLREIAGQGTNGEYQGQEALAGNQRLFAQRGIAVPDVAEPGTVVYLGLAGKCIGYLVIGDEVKEESGAAIRSLKEAGIRTVMLTGDRKAAGELVAGRLGIDEVRTELMPGDKLAIVRELMGSGKAKVGFVGDGMNDAPVLAGADIGIAMGQIGSDAAIEAADVIIMKDDLSKLATARRISKATLRIVRENIIFCLAVKALIMILGALGLANMWLAVFADVGVALIAILNSIRILYLKA